MATRMESSPRWSFSRRFYFYHPNPSALSFLEYDQFARPVDNLGDADDRKAGEETQSPADVRDLVAEGGLGVLGDAVHKSRVEVDLEHCHLLESFPDLSSFVE